MAEILQAGASDIGSSREGRYKFLTCMFDIYNCEGTEIRGELEAGDDLLVNCGITVDPERCRSLGTQIESSPPLLPPSSYNQIPPT